MRYNFGIFCPFLASLCATSKAFNIDGSKNVWDFREKATNEHKVVEDVTGGLFGTSVVTTDLISVVGAPGYWREEGGATGAVFVYRRARKDASEWVQEDFVVADDGEDGDYFGGAVAVSGGIMIVGAKLNSEIMHHSGAVYAYQRSVTVHEGNSRSMGWSQLAKLAPEDLLSQDYFGCSVAIHKNVTVVGAYGRDGGGTFSGAVFVYHVLFDEYGQVEFEFDELIVAEDATRYDWFGSAVAVHGNYILVGAPGADYNGNERSGAGYIFQKIASRDAEDGYLWWEMEKLIVKDGASEDKFGTAVAISGEVAVVGAEGSAHGSHKESGAAFVFTYKNKEWKYTHTLMASASFNAFTGFGHAVAIHRDTIVVTSYKEGGNGAIHGFNLVQPEKNLYYWVNSFSRVSSGWDGDGFGSSVSVFDNAVIVGYPASTYGSMFSYISNATTDALRFIPEEDIFEGESFTLPTSAIVLFVMSGIVLVIFAFVRFGGAIKKLASRRSFPGDDRSSLAGSYEDVDMDSEHSTTSVGIPEVELHRFSSRNPLNNRF